MTYELAKQLKDAGFPQNGKHCCGEEQCWSFPKGEEEVCRPTLSELIEACYSTLHEKGINVVLQSNNQYWVANGVAGGTAEEALANLWLALKK